MRIVKIICITLITSLFTACGSGNQKASSLFEIALEKNANQVNQNQEIGVSIKNKKEKDIESDYEYQRQNFYNLVEKGTAAIGGYRQMEFCLWG